MYDTSDMLVFVFTMFEKDGFCRFDEFKNFCYRMLGTGPKANLDIALESMNIDAIGRFAVHELVKVNRRFPHVLYPVFKIRVALARVTFGEKWWDDISYRLQDEAILKKRAEAGDEAARLKKIKMKEAQELIDRMGWWKYTFMPWERAKVRARIARVAAMDEELEEALEEDKKPISYLPFSYTDKPLAPERERGAYEIER
jgi:hypothetical protein